MKNTPDVIYLGFVLGHGGDALQMLELAAGTAARGLRVRVDVPALESTLEFAERGRQRGITVQRLPWLRADPVRARQNVYHVTRYLQAHRQSLIHYHTGNVCLPRTVLLAMDLLCMPRALVTVHSPYATLLPGRWRARYWAFAASRHMHRVICPSQHSRLTQLRYGLPRDRVVTIYNGVDTVRFGFGDGKKARRKLGVDEAAPLILFSSRLDEQKRPLDALRAFERVACDFPAARLVFAGCGAQEERVRAAAAKAGLEQRVHLIGYQNDIPDWLAAATVWMLPTESENFSLAVLEALAAGCPVLSTCCQGNDEILVDGKNALITPVGDLDALTAALWRLLADATLRARLSQAARESAKNYSFDRMLDQYMHYYTQAAITPARDRSERKVESIRH